MGVEMNDVLDFMAICHTGSDPNTKFISCCPAAGIMSASVMPHLLEQSLVDIHRLGINLKVDIYYRKLEQIDCLHSVNVYISNSVTLHVPRSLRDKSLPRYNVDV